MDENEKETSTIGYYWSSSATARVEKILFVQCNFGE